MYPSPRTMFRGRHLPTFFERTAPVYRELVERHGVEKVCKVYDYFFSFMSNMRWGQYMVVGKVCPDVSMRKLFYWVVECIYQSDLISMFRFVWKPPFTSDASAATVHSLCIECVEPTTDQTQHWQWFLPHDADGNLRRTYSLIDWFGRLRRDPKSLPEVDPEWLMLEATSDWGQPSDADMSDMD